MLVFRLWWLVSRVAALISSLTMISQTIAKATEMLHNTARRQRWRWGIWLEPVINEAVFMIELMSKKEGWRKRSNSINLHGHSPEYRRPSSASLRASISEGQSCASDGPFPEKCRLRSARVPSSRACQSARTLLGLSTCKSSVVTHRRSWWYCD